VGGIRSGSVDWPLPLAKEVTDREPVAAIVVDCLFPSSVGAGGEEVKKGRTGKKRVTMCEKVRM